jgi:broad specificity phosphatase PhoE
MPKSSGIFLGCALAILINFSCHAADSNAGTNVGWTDLQRGGYIIVMRHATTVPGTGDPQGYTLKDCATQRNLSDDGRAQARRWGAAVAKHRIPIGDVFSSEWCRCLDTAKLAFGSATPWAALNSFFDNPDRQAAQTKAIRARLASNPSPQKNTVLVTHQVNVTALTGVSPQMGEAVLLRADKQANFTISGRLLVD